MLDETNGSETAILEFGKVRTVKIPKTNTEVKVGLAQLVQDSADEEIETELPAGYLLDVVMTGLVIGAVFSQDEREGFFSEDCGDVIVYTYDYVVHVKWELTPRKQVIEVNEDLPRGAVRNKGTRILYLAD